MVKFGLRKDDDTSVEMDAYQMRIVAETDELIFINKNGGILAIYPKSTGYWAPVSGIADFSTLDKALERPPKATRQDYSQKGGRKKS